MPARSHKPFDAGSNPASATFIDRRRVAGYGLPGRFAKPCGRKVVRVRIPCLPLCSLKWSPKTGPPIKL